MTYRKRIELRLSQNGPIDRTLLARSTNAFQCLLEEAGKIQRSVKDTSVQEVAGFILNSMNLRIIERQDHETLYIEDCASREPVSSDPLPDIRVAFYLEDLDILNVHIPRGTFAAYTDTGTVRFGDFICLRDPSQFTTLFQAVNLFHEAKHALDRRQNPEYPHWSYAQKEFPAFAVEISITEHFGGIPLRRIVKRTVDHIVHKHGRRPGVDVMNGYASRYDEKLNSVFGKAQSEIEQQLRMNRLIFGFVAKAL